MTEPSDARKSDTFIPDALEGLIAARLQVLVERTLEDRIRQAVREELARGAQGGFAPDRREWLSQPAAAELGGVSVSTVRAWQAAGKLSRGDRGRVKAAELRALLAGAQAGPAQSVVDLKAAKIAGSLKGGR